MADALKVLAQVNPSAATLTDAYTVPAAASAIVDALVCNRSAVATSFRVSVAVAGVADAMTQYQAYDEVIAGNARARISGLTMATTDVVRVYATLATLTFTVVGIEVM